MKKYLYSIVLATLILMSTTVVNASSEVYYTNSKNIEMTEQEYNNLLTLGFTEKHIARMNQEEFLANKDLEGTLLSKTTKYMQATTTMRNGIKLTTVKEISEEEAKMQSQKVPYRGPAGNYYDGIIVTSTFSMTVNITGIGSSYMRFMNNVEWLDMPYDTYYDIIGIGMESAKVQFASSIIFEEEWVTTGGVHDGTEICAPKYVNTGGLAIFKLPDEDIQSLDIALYFNVMKQPNVGTITTLYATGDYAHAISNVNPSDLLSHISVSDSFGIMIDSTYSGTFFSSSAVTASFVGTW